MSNEDVCQNCEKSPAEPDHICPYAYELGGDCETCNCCDACETQCAMDI
jgi:hypothetical protein